jgi:hypothetical protein
VNNFIVLAKPVPARQRNAVLLNPVIAGHSTGSQQRRNPGASGQLTGRLSTSGVLTHNAASDTGANTTALDSILLSIGALRTETALAPNRTRFE